MTSYSRVHGIIPHIIIPRIMSLHILTPAHALAPHASHLHSQVHQPGRQFSVIPLTPGGDIAGSPKDLGVAGGRLRPRLLAHFGLW